METQPALEQKVDEIFELSDREVIRILSRYLRTEENDII